MSSETGVSGSVAHETCRYGDHGGGPGLLADAPRKQAFGLLDQLDHMCRLRNAGEVSKTGVGRPSERDPVEEIEMLGREVYGDDFEKFLATPRRSLDGETPTTLMVRGDYARVIALLAKMVNGPLRVDRSRREWPGPLA